MILPADGHPVATLVQPDGRIVLVSAHPEPDFVVRRLLQDGTPDRSFDGDGTAVADLGATEHAHGAVLQPDGSIVVVGTSAAGLDRSTAARAATGSTAAATATAAGEAPGATARAGASAERPARRARALSALARRWPLSAAACRRSRRSPRR
jgi:6-phosphogluconolactonase (cycloisomerase 2 family)